MVMAFILAKGPVGTVGVEVKVLVAVAAGLNVAVGGAGVKVGGFVTLGLGDSARLTTAGFWEVAVTNPAEAPLLFPMNWLYRKIPPAIRQARIRTPANPPPINAGRIPAFGAAIERELGLAGEAGIPGGLSTAIGLDLAMMFSGEEGGGTSGVAGGSTKVPSTCSGADCSMSVASLAEITAFWRVVS